jgi:hypothetical protein
MSQLERIEGKPVDNATVLSPEDVATYAIVTRPFGTTPQRGSVPAGTSLQELVDQVIPRTALRPFLYLFLGDSFIERRLWPRIRVKSGAHITGRIIPAQGGQGGKKNPLRIILQIVVAIIAIVTTVLSMGTLGPLWAGLLGAAITFGGTMLINAVAPIKPPKLADLSDSGTDRSPTMFIQGGRNRILPFGVVPRVFGKHRMTPPLGAKPFTEIVGEDQYLRMLFCWGYGPLAITDIKIGETPLSTFQDVQIETIAGNPGETFTTLPYPDVFEESFNTVLENPIENALPAPGTDDLWVTKVSQLNATSLSVDILFPQGLVRYNQNTSEPELWPAKIQIRYREVGAGSWINLPDWNFLEAFTQALRRGKQWNVAAPGQYEVQMRRYNQTHPGTSSRVMDDCFWVTLRTITPDNPVAMDGVCMTSIRIRGTKQLNGVIDELNGIASSILHVWDGVDWDTQEESANPAACAYEVAFGSANARPLPIAKMHLEDLQDAYDDCVTNGYKFNMIRDFQSSVWETWQDIYASMRASPGHRDGKWTVIMDRPQATPVQLFTPRNSSNFAGRISYVDVPHGLRVRFVNEDKNWEQDERIVYADGYDENNATKFEGIELPGVTDPDLIYKHTRFHYAQGLLRGEIYTFQADIEAMVCTRGDMIRVAHDVPTWSYSWGRVKALVTSGANTVGVTLDDFMQIEVGQSHVIRFRSETGVQSVREIVSTISGEFKTVTFVTPVATASGPKVGDAWCGGITNQESRELLVQGIASSKDMGGIITCVDYSPDVYGADGGEVPPFDSGVSDPLGSVYPVIQSLRSDEGVMTRNNDGSLSVNVDINFVFLSGRLSEARAIEIQRKPHDAEDDAWVTVLTINEFTSNVRLFGGVSEGLEYDFRARYQFSSGNPGEWSPSFSHVIVGKETDPPVVSNFRIEGPQDNRRLVWTLIDKPIDVDGYVLMVNNGNNTNPETAVALHPGVWADSPFVLGNQGLGEKTFLIFTHDAGGNLSATAASIIINLGQPLEGDNIDTEDYRAASFPGTITNGTIVGGNLDADAEGAGLFWTSNAVPFWTTDGALFWGGTFLEMIWEFTYDPDPAWVDVQDIVIYSNIIVVGPSPVIQWRKQGATDWLAWLGLTNDVEDITYEFKLTTPAGASGASITTAKVFLRAPVVSETIENLVVPTPAGVRLPLTKSYGVIRAVPCDIQQATGDARSVIVVDKDPVNGPLIKTYNAAGTQVAGLVDAHPRGN